MDRQEDIRRYLDREMSPDERAAFERELDADTQLKEQFTMENTIIKGIESFGRTQFKERVGTHVAWYRKRRIRSQWILGIAAVALISLLIYLFAGDLLTSPPSPTKQVFAQHFEPPTLPSSQRSGAEANLQEEARRLYTKKDYSGILGLAEQQTSLSGELALMAGVAALDKGDANAALGYLSNVSVEEVVYYDHAEWYIALTQLHMGNLDRARFSFQKMSRQPDHDHFEDAQEILKSL